MITCPVCGYLNPVNVVICQDCGSDLSNSPDLTGFEEEDYENTNNEDNYYEDNYDDTEYDEDLDDDYYDDYED